MSKKLLCPVCGNKKAEIRKAFVGDFFITDFISCRKCGLIRPMPSSVNDNLALSEIEKIAKAAKAEREGAE